LPQDARVDRRHGGRMRRRMLEEVGRELDQAVQLVAAVVSAELGADDALSHARQDWSEVLARWTPDGPSRFEIAVEESLRASAALSLPRKHIAAGLEEPDHRMRDHQALHCQLSATRTLGAPSSDQPGTAPARRGRDPASTAAGP